MPVSPQERQYLLSQVNRLASNDLQTLWAQADRLADVDFAAFVVAAFAELVDPYVAVAGELAATWFEEALPASGYLATTAELPPTQMLTTSARWALGAAGDVAVDRLEGTLQRAVFNGARDTTLLNVEATKSSWARHARASACAFCRLLATRGDVYTSKQTAAHKVHDHCYCLPIEVRDGDYEPPEYTQQWQDTYLKARADAGSGDPKAILAAWRQLDHSA